MNASGSQDVPVLHNYLEMRQTVKQRLISESVSGEEEPHRASVQLASKADFSLSF